MITLLQASTLPNYISLLCELEITSRDMNSCDGLLAQMQELLHLYQKDLSGVANEIRTLQVVDRKAGHD